MASSSLTGSSPPEAPPSTQPLKLPPPTPAPPARHGDARADEDEDEDEDDRMEGSSTAPLARRRRGVGKLGGQDGDDDEAAAASGDDTDDDDDDDDLSSPSRKPLHIEIRLQAYSTLRHDHVRNIVETFLAENFARLPVDGAEVDGWRAVDILQANCDSIKATDCTHASPHPPLSEVALQLHVYQASTSHAPEDLFAGADGDDDMEDGGEAPITAASVRELPSKELEGVWDTLIYEGDVKNRLLNYIYSTLLFSDAEVDFDVVTWNRVVLLHGPPGTGKTSLCRALAQKLSIRLSRRYAHGKLIEINSHSLFSKWFSESGKLVQRLFAMVTEMVEDESGFVVVLIDEVESLTAARANASSGTEPGDAMRVVNALLTQLDKLKHRKNVLIMTTSNLAQAIDSAFVDRADIKQYIGLPPQQAIYWILSGCLKELMRGRIIQQTDLPDWKLVQLQANMPRASLSSAEKLSLKLWDLAGACQGMSGRTLRRLPVLAHASYISTGTMSDLSASSLGAEGGGVKLRVWIRAMARCVGEENEAIRELSEKKGTTLL